MKEQEKCSVCGSENLIHSEIMGANCEDCNPTLNEDCTYILCDLGLHREKGNGTCMVCYIEL